MTGKKCKTATTTTNERRILNVRRILSAFETINWHRYINFERLNAVFFPSRRLWCAHSQSCKRWWYRDQNGKRYNTMTTSNMTQKKNTRRTHRSGNYSLSLTRNSFNYFISLNCSRNEKFTFSTEQCHCCFAHFLSLSLCDSIACVFDFLFRLSSSEKLNEAEK